MIIITGAAGLIGSAVLAKLNAEKENDILVVDELEDSIKWLNLRNKSYTEYIHKLDFIEQIRDGALTYYSSNDIKAIIHMGACSATTEDNMDYLYENNFKYTRDLARFALENNIRFIYASSAATYGAGEHGYNDDCNELEKLMPLNRYGYSKHIFDLWAKKNNVLSDIIGLKFFNVYGPNEYHKASMTSVPLNSFNQINKTGNVCLFKSYKADYKDGEQKRDFIYVKDCAEVIWWLINNKNVNGLYNLGSGLARTWNDLAKAVFQAMNLETKITYIDMPDNLINQYQYFTEANMQKFKDTKCPVKFHSLEEGIGNYVNSYLQQGFKVY
jgi:ADP-L-glycero-D-manno-heptose 6-epimerase